MPDLPLVAIVGRPNVGKSSLFNRIVGKRQALIQDRPGITRDRQYAHTQWDGVNFQMVDTGGLEFTTENEIEKKVTRQALTGIEEADVVVLVMDARAGVTPLDREWVNHVRRIKKPKIFAINKVDSPKEEEYLADFYELGIDELTPISAETGRRTGELLDRMIALLPKEGAATQKGEVPPRPINDKPEENLIRLCLIGRPNVGKSTLLNQFLGRERAIVDPTPGTTRDPVDSELEVEGQRIVLVDTAGIRKMGKTKEVIEKFSLMKSLDVVDRSDIALLLIDGIEGPTDQDAHVAGEAMERAKGLIIVVNKWEEGKEKLKREEMEAELDRKLTIPYKAPRLFISAKTGLNVGKIFPTVLRLSKTLRVRPNEEKLRLAFKHAVERHPAPVYRGRNIELKSIRQVGILPPTFLINASSPQKIHFSYQRYISNEISRAFDFDEIPIRLIFKGKN